MISSTLLGSGDVPSAENTYPKKCKFCLVVDTLVPVQGQSVLSQAFECCFQGLVVLLLGVKTRISSLRFIAPGIPARVSADDVLKNFCRAGYTSRKTEMGAKG